jgi:flagellar basal body-associated protein FliL
MKIKKEGSKRLKILIIVILLIIILLVGGFFGFKAYQNGRTDRDMTVFQKGFTYGYTSAVLQIINISSACQPFPVYVGNETTTLISVDCLRQV